MFCPKCGTKNLDTGKFCRKCGTDIGTVSEALSGKSFSSDGKKKKKKNKNPWEDAMTKLFMGFAFLTVSIILAFTETGERWWFWMLIPAFGMLGSGFAKVIQLRQKNQLSLSVDLNNSNEVLLEKEKTSLPPKQTDFVSDFPDGQYETGDLVPPSVVENTTRHLEINKEGETMTLPKDKI